MVRAHERQGSRRLAGTSAARRPWWAGHHLPAHPRLVLEWESAGPAVLLSGDLDLETAPLLEAFVAARPLTGRTVLELDLGGVPSVASAGLSVLLGLRRWCLQRGLQLRVRGAQPSVWRAFEVTGLDRVFASPGGSSPCRPAQDLVLF
jgi:anti-anti-sigma factor